MMNIFKRLFHNISKENIPPPKVLQLLDKVDERTEDIVIQKETVYNEFAIVSLCIDYIASNIANIPFELVKRKTAEPIRNTNLNKLLQRPNDFYTFEELIEHTIKEYLIYGYAIWDKGGIKPYYLILLNSNAVEIGCTDRMIDYIKYKGNDLVIEHTVKFLSYNPVNGVFSSKIDAVANLLNYDSQSLKRLIIEDKTFGAPRLLLSISGLTSEMQARSAKVELINQLRAQPGIPIVLGREVEVRNLSAEQKRNIVAERDQIIKEVTSTILGIPNIGSYSNTEVLELSIFLNKIVPLAKYIEKRINFDITYYVDKGIEFRFKFKETDTYRRILADFARAETLLLQYGIMSRNEIRRLLDLPQSNELSDFILASNLVEKIKEQPKDTGIKELILKPLTNSDKLDAYFKGNVSFSQMKKYYTTLIDIPALKPLLEEKLGPAKADAFINNLKQKFLELLVSKTGKFEFLEALEEWLNSEI